MEIGDKMGKLTQYSDLILNSKIKQLAEMSIHKNMNPFLALIEASNKTNIPFDSLLTTINEFDGSNWSKRGGDQSYRDQQSLNDKWNRHMQSKELPPEEPDQESPQDVEQLKHILKQVVQSLSIDHKISSDQINQLVTQATQGMSTKSVDTGGAHIPDGSKIGDFGTGSFTGDEGSEKLSPEMMKQFGAHSIVAPNGEDPFDMKTPVSSPTQTNPSWYDQMTNAEKAWFDNLKKTNPEAARQFVFRHDMGKTGDKNLEAGSEDWKQAQAIAGRTQQRNPWMKDQDATFKSAAGLWNRHKIRQDVAKQYGKGGEWEGEGKPLDDFDDLLHKDHKKNIGEIMNEWCHLAGVKEKKSKKKDR